MKTASRVSILTQTIVILILGLEPAWGAEPGGQTGGARRGTAVRTISPITLDGDLSETDWQSAAPIGEFLQREPVEGAAPTERTEVRVLYDSATLYIGIVCFDSDPGGIVATQMSRDADLSVDDRIEVLLDTFRDRRNAFYFSTNPAGALVDGLIIENGEINSDWNAIWNVRTRQNDDGWTAEFAIPFKSLSFSPALQAWGFNVSRTIGRKREEDRWSGARLDADFVQVSEAGDMEGLAGIDEGRGLDVRPFVSGRWIDSPFKDNSLREGDVGGDFFYNITPSLRLTTTVNTDFAETEVDDRQINLDRFPLFFPEKRSFFLENAGVFDFGVSGGFGPTLLPLFSRKIGLLGGREVPILAGVKLAGKAGRFDVGILDARTRETGFTDAQNYLAARVKRNILNQSYVGMIYTEGSSETGRSARTYGGDLLLGTSNFLGAGRNFNIQAFAVGVRNEGISGDSGAYRVAVAYPNDLWSLEGAWLRAEKNFDPALGFVQRPDTTRLDFTVEFAPRPGDFFGIRQMLHQFSFTRHTRIDSGQVESWQFFTAPLNWTWNSGDRFELNWRGQSERLFEPFEISDGVELQPGDYRFDRYRVEFFSSDNRPWKVDATWWFGSYWSGRAHELSGQFQYKLAPNLDAAASYNLTFARLPEGNFAARVFTLRADYSVTPFLTFFNLVQFDNDSNNLGWQSRIRWILEPGRDLFFVFNQGWIREQHPDGRTRFEMADRGVTAKLQYTFRF